MGALEALFDRIQWLEALRHSPRQSRHNCAETMAVEGARAVLMLLSGTNSAMQGL